VTARSLVIAAPRSGAGKTTVTLAILAALKRRGIAVRAAKAGPDYIDGAFHAAAIGTPGLNLDSWAMPPALLDALAAEAASAAELLIVEGVMGLFDGVAGSPGRTGATADLAARFALPVLLVLDVAGQSQSAAAVARGFAAHDPAVRISGVVLNRVGSDRHRMLIDGAMKAAGIPILGAMPRDPTLELPERHLGLVQASEHAGLAAHLDRLAAAAERHRGNASRSRATPRSASSIRTSSRDGGAPAPRSSRSRRLPTSRRRTIAIAAGCRAAIPSCTRRRSRPRHASAPGSQASLARVRCTASAAATWCSAKASRMPPAFAMPWQACSAMPRA
jgi:cobyrinic acid a,c-diamide synthase